MNDADLKNLADRRRRQAGFGEPEPDRTGPQTVETACALCGRPITYEPVPGPLAGYRPRLACRACLAAAAEREQAEARAAAEQARQTAIAEVRANPAAALAGCGVAARWVRADIGNLPDLPTGLVARARAWAAEPRGIVYVCGPPGCGKTTLACAMLRAVLERGVFPPSACRFIGEQRYLDGLKAAFDSELPPSRLLADGPARARLLVLDDLASTALTDWGRGQVAALVEQRHADDLPTITTSNLNLDELAARLDPRAASRLAQDGQVWSFPSRDLRLRNGRTKP